DRASRQLDADPRRGRPGDARSRRRRGGGARDHAGGPARHTRRDRGGRVLPRQRGSGLRHGLDARGRWRMDSQMIKRFHVLYVGQVDLENIGLQGTPANSRRYTNDKLSEPFFSARDVAQLMDDLGYSASWTAAHHFPRAGNEVSPNLAHLSLRLPTRTARLP